MRTLLTVALCACLAAPLTASTISNNDSCDIGTYPAATLLLPYFEVDTSPNRSQTTIFSITNVSAVPQVVDVTIWSDWGFPVISFPMFLTGYDVQPINLYDIIGRGIIAPPNGTSNQAPNARDGNGRNTNPNLGTQPLTNLANPNFFANVSSDCAPGRLPGQMPSPLSSDIRAVLTTGTSTAFAISCPLPNGQQAQVGGNHGGVNAVGYVTIDVVGTCHPLLPNDPHYWEQIAFDNVLTGDYQQIASDNTAGNYAGGNPLVHIRAVPAALPRTFYQRFTQNDKRQPLPSTFAARWIDGSTAVFRTEYKLWREPRTDGTASCASYIGNSSMPYAEIVRFDERENASILVNGLIIDPQPPPPGLPPTSRLPITNIVFPVMIGSSDVGGWMYFNLHDGRTTGVSQNWVTVSMFAEGRFGVESDATSLGNGCSPAAPISSQARDENTAAGRIGPRP